MRRRVLQSDALYRIDKAIKPEDDKQTTPVRRQYG